MLYWILIIAAAFIAINKAKYYVETRDNSLEGFIEYIKEKYYKKKD